MKISDIKNQKGGLLVEALAILGIVAVTSPMIYKKKIDKAQELDDIAKASQMKIIKEAVANYVDAHYEDFTKDDSGNPVSVEQNKTLTLNQISQFLPPGFDSDNTIKIGVHAEKIASGTNNDYRVGAIVVDSEKFNEKRGNRIASLIGADGGYADANGNATGNNSVWSLDVKKFGNDFKDVGSQIVSTTQFSKSAASGEYLYKYKVEGMPQVNTMMTNINMRGNDLNNAASVGLKFGKSDAFNSWRLNGYRNDGQQFGDGSIVGKNKSGFDTVALQANRVGYTELKGTEKDLALNNGVVDDPDHPEKKDIETNGYGALTLRAMNAAGKTSGCAEAISKSDLPDALDINKAGVFTACNNNAQRTAYLIADSKAGNGGELRLRRGGADTIGATVYSDKENGRGGAAFEATDAAGNVTVSMTAEKKIAKPHRYDGVTLGSSTDPGRSSLELGYGKKIQVTATADQHGGALYFRDTGKDSGSEGNHAVELIGDEALATVRDVNDSGAAAGLTGDYQAGLNGEENYFTEEKTNSITKPTPSGRGAFFVRSKNGSTPDARTVALVSGQESGGSDVGANMILLNGESRGLRATSIDGGALYAYNGSQSATVAVEGKRHLGTVDAGSADTNNGYAEVRSSGNTAAAEMYSNVSGKLGADGGSGDDFDAAGSGGAYIGYHGTSPNVKFMANGTHAGGDDTGGVLDLSDSGKKAILTATAKSETGGGNIGSAMRLSTGGSNYAHFGANGNSGAGEMVLKGDGGTVEAVAVDSSGGRISVKTAGGVTGVDITGNGDGLVNVNNNKGDNRVTISGGAVTAKNESNIETATIDTVGLKLRNNNNEDRVVFAQNKLQFYNPDKKLAVESNGKNMRAGNTNIQMTLTGATDGSAGVSGEYTSALNAALNSSDNVKGVILVGKDLTAKKRANAAVLKTEGNINFDNICILGKKDTEDDPACLAEAAARDAALSKKIEYGTWMDRHKKLSESYGGYSNLGRALWQMLAARVTDRYEGSQHNDTHHLKSAWGDKVKIKGNRISTGTAYVPDPADATRKGGLGQVQYVNDNAGYIYVTQKTNHPGYTGAKGQTITGGFSYYNVEKKGFEKVDLSAKYDYYEHESKAGQSYPGEEQQYSAAGHSHGATEAPANKKYYIPVFTEGKRAVSGDWGAGRDYKVTTTPPIESEQYVAKGHYHLNYKCTTGHGEKYYVRKLDGYDWPETPKNGQGFTETKVNLSQAFCDKYLDGHGDGSGPEYFYQGKGKGDGWSNKISSILPDNKWNGHSGNLPVYTVLPESF